MRAFPLFLTVLIAMPISAHEKHSHGELNKIPAQQSAKSESVSVTGEVIDLVCYIDHNATGAKHADCARTCIESGLPVGIKGEDGKTYMLVGEHKPINKQLAAYAAKTITVRGKLVSRDGFNMIENAEIVKK